MEGMELSLEVKSTQPFKLRVVEVVTGLPETLVQSIAPGPGDMTTFTCYCNDDGEMTFISSSFTFVSQ